MDGKGHASIAWKVMIGSWAVGAVTAIAYSPEIGAGIALGGTSGWLITPDADHNVFTHEERRWKGRRLIGPYLLGIWAGYGAKYKHRGRSHWHLWGTMTRIWYFGRRFAADLLLAAYVLIVLIADSVMDGSAVEAAIPYLPGWAFFLAWFLTWSFQDSVHIETDRIWSYFTGPRWERHRGVIFWIVALLIVIGIMSVILVYF